MFSPEHVPHDSEPLAHQTALLFPPLFELCLWHPITQEDVNFALESSQTPPGAFLAPSGLVLQL